MSEDRGFEVVDRRRTQATSESAGVPEPEEAGATPGGDDAEADEESFGGMPDVTVTGVLWTSVHLLVPRAWSAMGLIPNPVTGKIEQDMGEARRAIDVLADLHRHLQPDLNDQDKRELQNTLTDLRVNFVRQSGQG